MEQEIKNKLIELYNNDNSLIITRNNENIKTTSLKKILEDTFGEEFFITRNTLSDLKNENFWISLSLNLSYIFNNQKDVRVSRTNQCSRSLDILFNIQQLIEYYYGGIPNSNDWEDSHMFEPLYTIQPYKDKYIIKEVWGKDYKRPLTFKTKKLAERFLKFEENIQLLNEYFK